MKILHTSDWHLGRSLYGRKRYQEFEAFLNWLSATIEAENIDALLVAGDVFDTTTPSNQAQELYYRFLCQISASTCCRHIIIIAGNHDSPSFLDAPKELLRVLNVYVIGAATENPQDELLVLSDQANIPQAIICAVPYLRDKDIRTVEAGESIDDKNAKMLNGLKQHYANVCELAEQKQAEFAQAGHMNTPIIAMGHLFTSGGKTIDGDGVRELYVGSLAHIDPEMFPAAIDYFALGHLHVPQRVGDTEHIRYSGSPLPMGFGEATQDKKVLIVNFTRHKVNIDEKLVPCFQPLVRIVGSIDVIKTKIHALKQQDSSAWLEIEYSGKAIISDLREMLDEELKDCKLEVRRIKNQQIFDHVIRSTRVEETLDNLDPREVFNRCLISADIDEEQRKELELAYQEILVSFNEDDPNAS